MAQIPTMEESLANTIQSNVNNPDWYGPISLLMLMASTNDIISPWWSRRRDMELRNFVNSSDHVSGAIYNMVAKMTAIPVKVMARDESIKAHVEMAARYTDLINGAAGFGEGWQATFGKFVADLITQDNGAFLEIIGPGDPRGPITGAAISFANLDASRCVRTGNREFPVLYEDVSGKVYKLHYTRVAYAAQLPSNRVEMLGVGFCAVSRMINAAQNLSDIATYKQEKLGSRPPRQIMITGGGLDPEDLQLAMKMAENSMSGQGLKRFSKTIVAGNRTIPDPKLQVVDMASVPDGYNEKESVVLGMSVIAMALGMDARELFPAMETGATKADALVQHMKQRGKGPGQILGITETLFNVKFLPPQLVMGFDYQDDAQDRQVAEIRNIRSQGRQRNIIEGVTNSRVEREIMLSDGELTQAQFEDLELGDGRLPDGVSVNVLFKSDDPSYKSWLSGVTEANYESKLDDLYVVIMTSRDINLIKKARRAVAAINEKIVKPLEKKKAIEEQQAIVASGALGRANAGRSNRPTGDNAGDGQGRSGGSANRTGKPDQSYGQERAGRKIGADERVIRGDQQADPKMKEDEIE